MILVTAGTGNVGKHVVRLLSDKGDSVRALTRYPDRQEKIPNVEWVFRDPGKPEMNRDVMSGVDRMVLITPAHEDMVAHQTSLVDAALKAGVKKIVKLSGLGAGPNAPIRLPLNHHRIEQHIVSAGISYGFVRPNLFMQVLLGFGDSVKDGGVIHAPVGDGAISFNDARDVARVLVAELDKRESSIVEMTGPDSLTFQQAARIIGEVIGRDVRHVDVTPEQARKAMIGSGMDPWLADAFVELFDVYRAGHGAAVLTDHAQAAAGMRMTTMKEFVEAHQRGFA